MALELETSLIPFGHFGDSAENIVVIENFVEPADLEVVQRFVPTINRWENPDVAEFDNEGNRIYDASYWWDRMCSGRILEEVAPEICAILNKYITKMRLLLEEKFDVGLWQRPPVLVRWLPGNEQQPHADKQLNDGTPNAFPLYDLNSVIYWNDDFEGGEFYYSQHGIKLPIKAGMAVAHPGDVGYLHGVKTVISGQRWTTPSFYTITELRK